jgi:hypothetical protein
MSRSSGFPNPQPLSEDEFRANWLVALARLCREHGDSRVALWLGVTERHLRNLKSGLSMPTADKLWNLLAHDKTAHDEMDGAYGLKNVDADSYCSSDPLTRDVIALAHEVAEHEADESHGGQDHTDHELRLKDEARLRKVYRVLGTWLDRLDTLRGITRLPVKGKVA